MGRVSPSSHVSSGRIESDGSGDAISALVNLGYGRADAFSAVTECTRVGEVQQCRAFFDVLTSPWSGALGRGTFG